MKTITLPYPPSANRYWRLGGGHIHKSDAAKSYQNTVAMMARAAGVRPVVLPVVVTIDAYRPQKSGDLDNLLKVALDALKGIAYEDDKQVVEINARRFDDKHNPRLEVTIDTVAA